MKKLMLVIVFIGLTGCLRTRDEISAQDEQKVIQNQISEIRQSKADQELKSQSVENEMRNLIGRTEVLERKFNDLIQNESFQRQDSAKQMKDLVDQMKIFEESVANMAVRLERLEKTPKAENTEAKKRSTWDKADDLFVKKDWKNAALGFQDYIEQNPKGTNVSMAMYKIGVCFQELKMKSEAKGFFEDTIKQHPNSSAARKAKYRLNQIK